MIQFEAAFPCLPIDVSTWQEDEEWALYPEGARAKSAYFPPTGQLPDFIKPTRRYLFKHSSRRYPDQFWAEVVAYYIGCLLGVEVPPAYPAINSTTGQCGALIEWFYEDDQALLVMGGDFMQKMIPDFDRKRGRQHNFYTVRVLFRGLQQAGFVTADWSNMWERMLLFDALCGNTDRHQDNWGILFDRMDGSKRACLSPAYDNGTGLGHELSETHQGEWQSDSIRRYISRGHHHIKWRLDDTVHENHAEFIRKLEKQFPENGGMMLSLLSGFDMAALRENLNKMSAVRMPIALTEWRRHLIYALVETRRRLLIEVLQ